MLAEFLASLRKLADEARRPQILDHPHLRRHLLIAKGDGAVQETRRDISPVQVFPARLRGLAEVIRASFDAAIDVGGEVGPTITICEQSVHASLVDPEGLTDRSFAHLPLVKTDHWLTLEALESDPYVATPPDLVRWLRRNLLGTGIDGLIAALRLVEFNRTNDGAYSQEHGRESLGRQVEARVNNAQAIPETIVLNATVFQMPELEVTEAVRLGIDVDPKAERITLFVLPGQLERAMQTALERVHRVVNEQLDEVSIVKRSIVQGTNALQEAIDAERGGGMTATRVVMGGKHDGAIYPPSIDPNIKRRR